MPKNTSEYIKILESLKKKFKYETFRDLVLELEGMSIGDFRKLMSDKTFVFSLYDVFSSLNDKEKEFLFTNFSEVRLNMILDNYNSFNRGRERFSKKFSQDFKREVFDMKSYKKYSQSKGRSFRGKRANQDDLNEGAEVYSEGTEESSENTTFFGRLVKFLRGSSDKVKSRKRKVEDDGSGKTTLIGRLLSYFIEDLSQEADWLWNILFGEKYERFKERLPYLGGKSPRHMEDDYDDDDYDDDYDDDDYDDDGYDDDYDDDYDNDGGDDRGGGGGSGLGGGKGVGGFSFDDILGNKFKSDKYSSAEDVTDKVTYSISDELNEFVKNNEKVINELGEGLGDIHYDLSDAIDVVELINSKYGKFDDIIDVLKDIKFKLLENDDFKSFLSFKLDEVLDLLKSIFSSVYKILQILEKFDYKKFNEYYKSKLSEKLSGEIESFGTQNVRALTGKVDEESLGDIVAEGEGGLVLKKGGSVSEKLSKLKRIRDYARAGKNLKGGFGRAGGAAAGAGTAGAGTAGAGTAGAGTAGAGTAGAGVAGVGGSTAGIGILAAVLLGGIALAIHKALKSDTKEYFKASVYGRHKKGKDLIKSRMVGDDLAKKDPKLKKKLEESGALSSTGRLTKKLDDFIEERRSKLNMKDKDVSKFLRIYEKYKSGLTLDENELRFLIGGDKGLEELSKREQNIVAEIDDLKNKVAVLRAYESSGLSERELRETVAMKKKIEDELSGLKSKHGKTYDEEKYKEFVKFQQDYLKKEKSKFAARSSTEVKLNPPPQIYIQEPYLNYK